MWKYYFCFLLVIKMKKKKKKKIVENIKKEIDLIFPSKQGPVVQSVVSLTSSLRVISLTVLADSIYNILIFFCTAKATHIFFSKKFQHICVSLDVNFNESLTNDVVSFERLGPGRHLMGKTRMIRVFLSMQNGSLGLKILKFVPIKYYDLCTLESAGLPLSGLASRLEIATGRPNWTSKTYCGLPIFLCPSKIDTRDV